METKTLSKDAIAHLFCATGNIKHRLLLMMAYSSGLPLKDLTCLKVTDVDPIHRRIRAHGHEGVHYGMLSKMAAVTLRNYLTDFPVKTYLFSGMNGRSHLSQKGAEEIFAHSLEKAGITQKCSIHCLYASFYVHLREKLSVKGASYYCNDLPQRGDVPGRLAAHR
jgi:site-specific recombinase XerD